MTAPLLLHVEDNLDDRILLRQACVQAGASFCLFSVEHGQGALDYLSASGAYGDRSTFPSPEAVLLDLKMPMLDGFAVLRWIRAQPALRSLPVLVFTSSYQDSDIQRAYTDGANAFFTKPSTFENLVRLAGALDESFAMPDNVWQPVRALPEYKQFPVETRRAAREMTMGHSPYSPVCQSFLENSQHPGAEHTDR